MTTAVCPSCGSSQVRILGDIPASTVFAGVVVGTMPARLGICRECHLGFRDPQPSRERLGQMYAAGSDSAWDEHVKVRRDWAMVRDLVVDIGARSVLDVGCFDGGFLKLLPEGIERVGVEIHPGAVARAGEHGVRVVCEDLYKLPEVGEQYDCVVAFDVIEHVHDPRDFLATLASVVRPGGHLVFVTGDLDAPTWRVMGSRYLYSWFQEHIAFVSPRWVRAQAPRMGLEVVETTRFTHRVGGWSGFLIGLAKNLAYRIAPGLVLTKRAKALESKGIDPSMWMGPPAWTSARDHFVAVLRKP